MSSASEDNPRADSTTAPEKAERPNTAGGPQAVQAEAAHGHDPSIAPPEPAGAPVAEPARAHDANDANDGNDAGAANRQPVGPIVARFAGRTAVGLVREHNEDNLVVADLTKDAPLPQAAVNQAELGPAGLMFAVCDGMGGAAAGEVASQMAVDILFEAMRRGGPPEDRDDVARRLVSAVEEAGRRIHEEAQQERSRRGMGTTATASVLVDKVLFLAEVGDSRGYLLRGGELRQVTKDQSLVNQLIEAGHLTEEEAEAFEHSNIILQALGTSASVQVDLTFVELRRGDRLLLCSDGLSGLVHDETITEVLRDETDPDACATRLIELAEAGGGHDNITVIVVDFTGEGLAEPREGESFGYLQYPLPPAEGEVDPFSDDAPRAAAATVPSPKPADAAPSPEAPDRTSMLWVLAGVVALLIGGAVIALSPSDRGGDERPGSAALEPSAAPDEGPGAAESTPAAPAPGAGAASGATADGAAGAPSGDEAGGEVAGVQVLVRTDVEGAQLLVNGEAHGDLQAGKAHAMRLPPGAYRFEAQTEGNPAAVEVVTVRDGVPLEVNLKLPAGSDAVPGALSEADARRAARRERREARRLARERSGSAKPKKKPPAPPDLPAVAAPPPPPTPPPLPAAPEAAPQAPAAPTVVPDNPF